MWVTLIICMTTYIFDMFYIVVIWSCMERSLLQLLFIAILVKLIWYNPTWRSSGSRCRGWWRSWSSPTCAHIMIRYGDWWNTTYIYDGIRYIEYNELRTRRMRERSAGWTHDASPPECNISYLDWEITILSCVCTMYTMYCILSLTKMSAAHAQPR